MSAATDLGHRVTTYLCSVLLLVLLAAYAPEALLALAVLCAAWWLLLRLFRHTDSDDRADGLEDEA